LDPDVGPMRIESLHRTYSLGSGEAARPNGFESALMSHPSNLGEAPLSSPKFLGSGRGSLTQVNNNNNNNNNNNFYVFFFPIVIIFISNLIILMNIIIFIIILNSSDTSFIFFNPY
jgi:hypothetical protein